MSRFLVSFVNTNDPNRLLYIYDSTTDCLKPIPPIDKELRSVAGICKTPFGYVVVTAKPSHPQSCLWLLSRTLENIDLYECNVGHMLHSLLWSDQKMLAANTGHDSVVQYEFSMRGRVASEVMRYQLPGAGADVYHLNSLCEMNGKLYGTIFGSRESPDNLWWESQSSGAIIDVERSLKIRDICDIETNLGHPHTLKNHLNGFAFCEASKGIIRTWKWRVALDGYVRGFDFDHNFCYVGVSASRKYSRSTGRENEEHQEHFVSGIWVLDKDTGDRIRRIDTDHCGAEIYDIQRID